MSDCIFCKIANGEIPSAKVFEDETVLAFRDLNPQAPQHILVIPKQHASNLLEARSFDDTLLAHLMRVTATVAEEQGLAESGFRIVSNCGDDACQSVHHLHIHILGGRKMADSMV